MNKLFYLVLGVAAFAAAPASATIVIDTNPGMPTSSEFNINFETLQTGLTITGDTDKTNQLVIFDTNFAAGSPNNMGGAGTMQNITTDGLGQANIVCAPGGPTACVNNGSGIRASELTSLEMKPGAGTAWTDAYLNPDTGTGMLNVWVKDDLGNSFDFMLKPGQNIFRLTASGGEVITDIQLTEQTGATGAFGWADFKQPRVSGVCTLVGTTCTPLPVSEPGSLALLGTALLGLTGVVMRRRRR